MSCSSVAPLIALPPEFWNQVPAQPWAEGRWPLHPDGHSPGRFPPTPSGGLAPMTHCFAKLSEFRHGRGRPAATPAV